MKTHEQIAELAKQIWLEDGMPVGRDEHNWLVAERILDITPYCNGGKICPGHPTNRCAYAFLTDEVPEVTDYLYLPAYGWTEINPTAPITALTALREFGVCFLRFADIEYVRATPSTLFPGASLLDSLLANIP